MDDDLMNKRLDRLEALESELLAAMGGLWIDDDEAEEEADMDRVSPEGGEQLYCVREIAANLSAGIADYDEVEEELDEALMNLWRAGYKQGMKDAEELSE